jgi:ribonuclease D
MDKLRASLQHGHASRRAKSHDEAAVGGGGDVSLPAHDNVLICRAGTEMISTTAGLVEFLEHARAVGSVAYDSEFIGELTYRPVLCLVQLATHERVALVDPIVGDALDLTPLWELLADGSVEKVVHAGEQDLEPVVRLLGRGPANVMDVQVAAGFCGYGYPLSLAKLVGATTGVALAKGHTFTNWQARPLTSSQLRYAADDVRYLPAARAALGREVEARGHGQALAEEMAALCVAGRYVFDADVQIHRVRGSGGMDGKQTAVLRELVIWRDQAAKAADLPPRVVVRDEVLIDLARYAPKGVEGLGKIKGLPKPIEAEHGEELIAAIGRGLAAKVVSGGASGDRDQTPRQKFQADAAMGALALLCSGAGVDVQLAASRADLTEFLAWREMKKKPAGVVPALLEGWRGEKIGRPLMGLLDGEKSMLVSWRGAEAVSECQ